jgi:molecular chaperone GrpE (heat shock protein)
MDSEIMEPAGETEEDAPKALDLETALREIHSELVRLREQNEFLNKVLDRMHSENETLRRAESQRALPAGARELIKLADDWRSRGADLKARTEPCSADRASLCAEIVDDVTLILQRQGVEEFWPATGVAFDRQEQRAVATRATDEPALDGTVAHTRRPGYRMEDRVVRFAEVEVQRRTTG